MKPNLYDVIVVGARCAGSSLAMLLARQGAKVLLLDRFTRVSDILSTHTIQLSGLACLERWGIREELLGRGCQPYTQITMDFEDFSFTGTPIPLGEVKETVCCRRPVLDGLLLEKAIAAGVEWQGGVSVQQLLTEHQRVVGLIGVSQSGRPYQAKATLVVGADGMRSTIAHLVQAPEYHTTPSLTFSFYAYWAGLNVSHAQLYIRDGGAMALVPTNERSTIAIVQQKVSLFSQFAQNVEQNFYQAWQTIPSAYEQLAAGVRVEPFRGTPYQPNFLRQPYGAGWALVGDAGCHKDSVTAQGISNAFYDAELLAEAIGAGLSGRLSFPLALQQYHQQRDNYLLPTYNRTVALAKLERPEGCIRQLLEALTTNENQRSRFLGIDAGSISASEFFSEENIRLILPETELIQV